MKIFAVCLCIVLVLSGCAMNSQSTVSAQNPDDKAAATTSEQMKEVSTEPEDIPAEAEETVSGEIIEPEQLISQAEAEEILGTAVSAKNTEQGVVGLKLCFYDAGDTGYLQIGITQQSFIPTDSPNTPKSIYDGIHKAFSDGKTVSIGDEAFLASGGYHIMQSGYYITVSAGNTDEATVNAIMDDAGKLAVKNLLSLIAS